jgi:hypothetical protein
LRIKFEKGMTPERIAQAFVNFVQHEGLVIGAVNVYIQTYDENMKVEKNDSEYYTICEPSAMLKNEYREDVADIRRSRLKVVNE